MRLDLLPLLSGGILGDHGVLSSLGPVHQPVRPLYRLGDRLLLRHDASHADGDMLAALAARYAHCPQPPLNVSQHGGKGRLLHARQQQQKLIAAVAHQRAAAAYYLIDGIRQHPQRVVAHLMAIYVVIQLQIVHIDERYTAAVYLIAHIPLVMVAAQRAGQRVYLLLLGVPPGDDQHIVADPVDADVILPAAHTALTEPQAKALVSLLFVEKAPQVFAAEIAHPHAFFRRHTAVIPKDVTQLLYGVPFILQPTGQVGFPDPQLSPGPVIFTYGVADRQQCRDKGFLLDHG